MAARLTRPLNRGTDWEVRWRSGHMDKGLDKAAPSDPNVLLFCELRRADMGGLKHRCVCH